MTLEVLFEPEAVNELREARRWYDDVRPGLGGDLLAEVEMSIEHALRWPELAPPACWCPRQRVKSAAHHCGDSRSASSMSSSIKLVGARHRPRSTPASLLARAPTVSDAQPVLLDEPPQTVQEQFSVASIRVASDCSRGRCTGAYATPSGKACARVEVSAPEHRHSTLVRRWSVTDCGSPQPPIMDRAVQCRDLRVHLKLASESRRGTLS